MPSPTRETSERPNWSSQRAYVLASVAGVVGLGNLWRFPYMVGENGGGSFIVAYLICVLLIGIPLAIVEVSAGKYIMRGPVGVFRSINPVWGPWFGWFLVGMTVLIMSYYFVITGWTLGYAGNAIVGNLSTFPEFTDGYTSLWLFMVVCGLVVIGLMKGVGGVEATSKFLMPLLVLIVGSLAIYGQSLDGASAARDFYFSVEWDQFTESRTWRMAAGQAFYSLSIGLGFLITYGSYAPRNLNVLGSTTAVAATNSTISMVAGLMVFPIVFTFGLQPDAGSQLSFTAIPVLLNDLAAGRLIGVAFFVLLFLAAFTSCYGGMMIPMTAVRYELNLSKFKAAVVATSVTAMLGIPSALSFTDSNLTLGGQPFLDRMDQITGSGTVLVAGFIGTALLAWFIPLDRLTVSTGSHHARKVSYGVIYIARFVPLVAATAFAATSL